MNVLIELSIFLLIGAFFYTISKRSSDRSIPSVTQYHWEDRGEIIEDSMRLRGWIEKRHFYDKGQRKVDDVFDYYFVTQDADYFIKILESRVSQQELERHVGRTVSIRGTLKSGLFDYDPQKLSANAPVPQSRVGEYLTIIKFQRK